MTQRTPEGEMKMSRKLVILIESEMDAFTEQDMRRWVQHRCKKHVVNGETFWEVDSRWRVKEGIKRFASFTVRARPALRPCPRS